MKFVSSKISDESPDDETTIIKNVFKYAEKVGNGSSRLKYVLITSDDHVACGVLNAQGIKVFNKFVKHVDKSEIVKTGGAGDSLLGGVIYGLIEGSSKGDIEKAIELGIKCAQLSVISSKNVNPAISQIINN